MKKYVRTIALVVASFIVVVVALLAAALWGDRSAERKARAFCDAIPIGSDISGAIAKANAEKILWGTARFYSFYFPGVVFDKAICEVEVDGHGIVAKKGYAMEHD